MKIANKYKLNEDVFIENWNGIKEAKVKKIILIKDPITGVEFVCYEVAEECGVRTIKDEKHVFRSIRSILRFIKKITQNKHDQ